MNLDVIVVATEIIGKAKCITTNDKDSFKIDPKYALSWNSKGATLDKLGKFDEAIRCFDEAIKISPELADAWRNKGLALDILGRFEEAMKCYDEAASYGGISGGLLVKTDSAGYQEWIKTCGGTGYELAYSVHQTSDGGYIVAGTTLASGTDNWDFLLMKIGPETGQDTGQGIDLITVVGVAAAATAVAIVLVTVVLMKKRRSPAAGTK